jgi:7-cyano-7-deazaguanine synthase
MLLSMSLSCFPFTEGIISLGIHSGTKYADCSPSFIELNQKIINLCTNGNIIIDCPFLFMNKNDIYKHFLKSTIPIELTYSCELGKDTPCGKCLTCLDLKALKNESED